MRVAFGMITLNAEEFVAQSIASVYDFADRIVVVDGATPAGRAAATSSGGSTDATLEIVRALPDPSRKIVVLPSRFYADKNEQSNAYMAALDDDPPDYVWQLDSDELYHPRDLARVADLLERERAWHASFRALHFWHDFEHVGFGSWWTGYPFHRVNKFWRGARYAKHRPPTILVDDKPIWDARPALDGDMLEREGIYLYHYSHVTERQVAGKMTWYLRDGMWTSSSQASASTKPSWVEDVWRRWLVDPKAVEAIGTHPVNLENPNDGMGKGSIRLFRGDHPRAIETHPKFVKRAAKAPRVVHVMQTLGLGGGTRSPLQCASKIAEMTGIEQDVVVLEPFPANAVAQVGDGVRVIDMSAASLAETTERIVDGGYDVVHAHWWEQLARQRVLLLALSHFGGHKRVLSCYSHPAAPRFRLGAIERDWLDAAVFSGDDTTADYLDDDERLHAFTVVASEDLDAYAHATPAPTTPGSLRIGRASTLDPWKVPSDLVAQIAPILHAVPDAEMHIFGHGPLEKKIARDIRRFDLEGRVFLRGWVSDLPSEMKALDVYLYHLPRRSFASSELNLQGAMAAGLPVVAVPSEGTRWMFAHAGVACVDGARAAEVTIELLRDEQRRRALGAHAAGFARTTWGLDAMARGYLERVFPSTRMRFPLAGRRPPPLAPNAIRAALQRARARALELGIPEAPLDRAARIVRRLGI